VHYIQIRFLWYTINFETVPKEEESWHHGKLTSEIQTFKFRLIIRMIRSQLLPLPYPCYEAVRNTAKELYVHFKQLSYWINLVNHQSTFTHLLEILIESIGYTVHSNDYPQENFHINEISDYLTNNLRRNLSTGFLTRYQHWLIYRYFHEIT